MRLLLIGLVLSMSVSEIERAQQVARSRESERQQFHRRYVIDVNDATVTQFEVLTEFRRLVLVTEEHIFRGDWMFSRGTRLAEDALKPFRGVVTLRSTLRFHPLNAYVTTPAYVLAVGAPGGPMTPLDTQITPQYSAPFKNRGKTLTSLLGATIEATAPAAQVAETSRAVAVVLDGRELARTTIDFSHLD